MAEFVQQSIEETIPELEQLERVGLFAKEEIKLVNLSLLMNVNVVRQKVLNLAPCSSQDLFIGLIRFVFCTKGLETCSIDLMYTDF